MVINEKILKGSGRGLIEVVFRNLREEARPMYQPRTSRTEKNNVTAITASSITLLSSIQFNSMVIHEFSSFTEQWPITKLSKSE